MKAVVKSCVTAAVIALAIVTAPSIRAGTRDFRAHGHTLPSDKPVKVVLVRPDVEVGQLQVGGLVEPNADWTEAARHNLAAALADNQQRRGIAFAALAEPDETRSRIVTDYSALHRTVVNAILGQVYGARLPTKRMKDGKKLPGRASQWDWTLGPGTRAITEDQRATYGLFLFARDNFSTDSRKAMQVAGILGCVVGFCSIVTGGQHIAYASLVDLESGDIVWFNILRGSKGDVREPDGARAMVDAIMASMPTRPGEGGK